MIQIRCDACRKDIRDAHKDVNYSSLLGREFCTPCFEKLHENVGKGMSNRKPYRFSEYQELLRKTIVRMSTS